MAGLRWRSAEDKTRIVLARLRMGGIAGEQLLEVALAVAALVRQHGIIRQAYLLVQIAKALLRFHTPKAWRESDGNNRSEGRFLQVLGRNVWFFALVVATPDTLATISQAAQPGVALAAKAEARRKERHAVLRRTEDGVAREIKRARDWGAGPQELARLEAQLRQRYGLKAARHA